MLTQIISIILFLVIGGIFLYGSISNRIKVNSAARWPKTKAIILESEVEEDRARSAFGKATFSYIPVMKYEFTVMGQKYTGTKVTFGNPTYDYITASKICDKFSVGSEPDVTYNPEDPTESVLAPKSYEGLRSVIPGVFFILVAVIIAVVAILYPDL